MSADSFPHSHFHSTFSNMTDPSLNSSDTVKNSKPFIPPVPEQYCFVDENFLSETFSVDGFVRRNSKRVNSLERLREQLTNYLKILKQSMIELINEDYTEFINLSSNLVSFDKSITNIKTPVLRFKNETINTKLKIEEIIFAMNAKKERLKTIGESKQKLNMILEIIDFMDRIEENMANIEIKIAQCQDVDSKKIFIYTPLIECSTLIARLNANFDFLFGPDENRKLSSNQFLWKFHQRFKVVREKFYKILENEVLFLLNHGPAQLQEETFRNKIIELLEQLFLMYLIDGNRKELEMIIRNHIVRPYFEEIIIDSNMSKNELENMFEQILNFIDEKFFLIIQVLTISQSVFHSFKFELITVTIWTTFVDLFSTRTPLFLDLSDSETFQENYLSTFRFIERFLQKTCLSESRYRFEQLDSFIQLKSKFRLNVYYHMKLKKIAMNLENCLQKNGFSSDGQKNGGQAIFNFNSTRIIHENIVDCWRNATNSFYIGDLFIYLWKLTVKIVSRFAKWINQINLGDIESFLKQNNHNLHNADLKRLVHQTLCALIVDSRMFLRQFKQFCQDVIHPIWDVYYNTRLSSKILANANRIEYSSMKQSFDDVERNFNQSAIDKMICLMKTEIIEECKRLLNLVNDIPRLYRRTNKEKPKEASGYIIKCVEQFVEYIGMIGFDRNDSTINQWLNEMLNEIAQHYKHLTLEVLTSVQKTEDSLKKLKKLKANPNLLSSKNATMSDDDKIRLQIFHDVQAFGIELQKKLGFDAKSIKPYNDLLDMTDSLKVLQ